MVGRLQKANILVHLREAKSLRFKKISLWLTKKV